MAEKQLPEGWRMVKFGDIAKQCKESVDRENNPFERYIEGGHMDSESLKIKRWGIFGEDYVGPAFHRIFRKGQILYGSRRTYLKKVAVADFDGITANTTFVIEPKDSDLILPELLPFIMLSDGFTKHSVQNSKGSTNPYINWSDIANYEFKLPRIEEQVKILDIFFKIEENIGLLESLINSYDESRNVIRNELLLKEDSKNAWQIKSISEIAEINPVYKIDKENEVTFCDMAALDTDSPSITGKIVKRESKAGGAKFLNGDILFARITPCAENGKMAIVDFLEDGEVGKGSTEFIVLSPRKVSSKYLYNLCRTNYVREYAINHMEGSTGRQRIPNNIFDSIMIPVAPKKFHAAIDNVFEEMEGSGSNM